MKKKEFWEYDDPKGNKAKLKTNAPELSFGSRLIRYLLIFCCVTAAATVIISMFCYFFPLQSASIAQSIQDFTSGIFQEEKKSDPKRNTGGKSRRNAIGLSGGFQKSGGVLRFLRPHTAGHFPDS